MSFLPEDYKQPKSNSHYLKLETGDNLIRILAPAVLGWQDWVEVEGKRSPFRSQMDAKPAPFNSEKPVKHFWAFPVWDYKDGQVKILEITQSSIQEAIYNLDCDESWGDPTGYDLKINRSGEKLETKYSVIAKPPKEMSPEIVEAFKEANPNLQALFSNDDPFAKNDLSNIPF